MTGSRTTDLMATLGPGLTQRLTVVSQEYGVDRFVVLMAVFQILIGRYDGVQRAGVRAPVSDRRDLGTCGPAGQAGQAENLVVIRASWADEPTFAELLGRVRTAVLSARQDGQAPAGTVEPVEPVEVAAARVSLAMSDIPLGTADLAVTWQPDDSGDLRGIVRYDVGQFDRAIVERLMSHYTALLEAALAAPETRVSRLVHTTPAERALVSAWGIEGSHADRPGSLVEMFRRQAEATPGAVALEFGDETLTYAELRGRSEQLAEALVLRGVTPESVVGLAMGRSAALVVAMLAVVTAGAAYLPLDADYPEARLALMTSDSEACLVLADESLSWVPGVPVVGVDELTRGAGTGAGGWRAPRPHPDQRACVLYTSGSTGRPKGVATTHRGIVRLVCEAPFFACDRSDVIAQASSPSFDAASLEIWGALLNGARLVGISKDEALSTELLAARIKAHGITAMFLATSVFHIHADAAPEVFAPLRVLYFGGEPADARRLAAARAVAPGLRLVNGYGPTECTTFASTFSSGKVAAAAAGVPIGRPVPETGLHVLDDLGRATGVGVPGELYIGGGGLARGYVGRPDLTAERFVASPFGNGERLYRTGDVARWREDGLLECLGRVDTQVKIRGVRIEPEEVASVLGGHPRVRTAVVGARGVGATKRLVAYVVPDGGQVIEPRELRTHLAARLPEAMVPTWYVPLAELPLTPNGKVDRRALPAPVEENAVHTSVHVAPMGTTEQCIADIWAEILGVSTVSVTDDFLALGGNSLLATRVVARIGSQLGVKLRIGDLLETPTVAAVAARVTAAGTDADPPLVPIGDGPHHLSFAQQRMWFLDQLAPATPLYTVPLVMHIEGRLDVPALAAGIQAIVRRHASLRTLLVAGKDGPRQVVAEDLHIALEVDDLRHLPDQERRRHADELMDRAVRRAFELSSGPLIRARLLRLAEERFELLITMHHAVCDGWSVGVLVDDLASFYASTLAGTEAALPQLPVQYADYAEWQRGLLDGGVREHQLTYWSEQLRGAPATVELPIDRARRPVPRYVGDTLPLRLPADLTRQLTETSRALGVTSFTTLLGMFQLLLGQYAGTRDISVGTAVSGRTRPETEQLIGCFINTLVVRTRWQDDLTFGEFLARVRASTLGAYDHQDVPFEDVVEALNPPRVAGRTPLIQTMVAMRNLPAGTERFPGLSVSLRELASPAAKLDLVVRWDEVPDASGELTGIAEYDADLFDQETVERIVEHYVALLDAALADPGTPVSNLPMPDREQRGARADLAQALPSPGRPADRGNVSFAGALEAVVAAVWQDVLELDSVAADDNFFEVGGTSLQVLRVQEGLLKATGRRLPVVDMFRFPTVRALARHLVDGDDGPSTAGAAGRRRAAARKDRRARARKPDGATLPLGRQADE